MFYLGPGGVNTHRVKPTEYPDMQVAPALGDGLTGGDKPITCHFDKGTSSPPTLAKEPPCLIIPPSPHQALRVHVPLVIVPLSSFAQKEMFNGIPPSPPPILPSPPATEKI